MYLALVQHPFMLDTSVPAHLLKSVVNIVLLLCLLVLEYIRAFLANLASRQLIQLALCNYPSIGIRTPYIICRLPAMDNMKII